ncbi:hypothetical protein LO763_11705 [Glycomyces sp. A-F 0318]|uniref:hypothetical protein n=1 Tax=Glycomyces amatae TaxID=2881355 RepID=UPI001E3ACDD5|nr:hypothetical protein [Glycomyces amatae]MCD0444287.1 hypothetical protein [Glycomyces amatae]
MDDHATLHAVGDGFLAVPEAERDSGRWGTVCLTDADGIPIPLRDITAGRAVALTATPLPDTDSITLPVKRELLGVGAAFTTIASVKGRRATGVGVRPANGRLTDWLFPPTAGRLLGRRVRLEVHVAWPACTCGALTAPGNVTRMAAP